MFLVGFTDSGSIGSIKKWEYKEQHEKYSAKNV
jgi:hypothetical protein